MKLQRHHHVYDGSRHNKTLYSCSYGYNAQYLKGSDHLCSSGEAVLFFTLVLFYNYTHIQILYPEGKLAPLQLPIFSPILNQRPLGSQAKSLQTELQHSFSISLSLSRPVRCLCRMERSCQSGSWRVSSLCPLCITGCPRAKVNPPEPSGIRSADDRLLTFRSSCSIQSGLNRGWFKS